MFRATQITFYTVAISKVSTVGKEHIFNMMSRWYVWSVKPTKKKPSIVSETVWGGNYRHINRITFRLDYFTFQFWYQFPWCNYVRTFRKRLYRLCQKCRAGLRKQSLWTEKSSMKAANGKYGRKSQRYFTNARIVLAWLPPWSKKDECHGSWWLLTDLWSLHLKYLQAARDNLMAVHRKRK